MTRRLNDRGTPPNFDYTPRKSTVYRFHDRVAVHLGDGATAYMTAAEVKKPGFFILLAPRTDKQYFARFTFNPPRRVL